MKIYKTNIGNEIIESKNLEDILIYGNGYTSQDIEDVVYTKPLKTLQERIDYGEKLRLEFLQDNYDLRTAFTPEIALAMSTGFANIKSLCLDGDLRTTLYLLKQVPVNTIFTQERKDKYINDLEIFLA